MYATHWENGGNVGRELVFLRAKPHDAVARLHEPVGIPCRALLDFRLIDAPCVEIPDVGKIRIKRVDFAADIKGFGVILQMILALGLSPAVPLGALVSFAFPKIFIERQGFAIPLLLPQAVGLCFDILETHCESVARG